jgi:uncharacterized protein YodC (DUF2158 family)
MQPGDVVKLKSGGAQMTIESRTHDTRWNCVWWNRQTEKYEERMFHEQALRIAESDSGVTPLRL